MKTIILTYCGMEGGGSTLKEAKLDATRKIERVLAADYTPRVISFRGTITLIWRTPSGLCSSILSENNKSKCYTLHTSDSMDDVEEQARYQLAQIKWDEEEERSPLLGDLYQNEFSTWVRFQKKYKEAISRGKSDTEAHAFACAA